MKAFPRSFHWWRNPMWWLYEMLYGLGFLAYLPAALARRRLPHSGWSMRLGRYPEGHLAKLSSPVWLHAVSVGEVLAAKPLIRALESSPGGLLVSTITPSGQSVARAAVAEQTPTVYFPLDLSVCIRKALRQTRPRALLLMESELWPRMISIAAAEGIPIAVVNGRVSPRSYRRYRALRDWTAAFLPRVNLFLMQSETDRERLIDAGVAPERIRVTGNLKWDASTGARPDPSAVAALRARLNLPWGTPMVAAGSTHRGEEGLIFNALRHLRASLPQTRLVLAARHLERLDEVETLCRSFHLRPCRASQLGADPWDVLLVDTFGELPLYYALADVALIGGSWIPHGGQNPLEASSLGKPVLFGPYMHNFPEIHKELVGSGGAFQLESASLPQRLLDLLRDAEARDKMGRKAVACVARHTGATRRTLEALEPLLRRS